MQEKIEFIEETVRSRTGDFESYWYTAVDDISVPNSFKFDYDKAFQIYCNILENRGKCGRTVLITNIIGDEGR